MVLNASLKASRPGTPGLQNTLLHQGCVVGGEEFVQVLAELSPFCSTVSRLAACDNVDNLILFVVELSTIVIPGPSSSNILPFKLSRVVTTPCPVLFLKLILFQFNLILRCIHYTV